MIIAAQELIKAKIDKTQEESKCRMCECSKIAQTKYKGRHDWIVKRIHWDVCRKYGIKVKEKRYEHQPQSVVENENCKILWGFNIQTDHVIEARRPDMIVVDKVKKTCTIIDLDTLRQQSKQQRDGKDRKILKFSTRAQKIMEHESEGYSYNYRHIWSNTKAS